MKICHVCSGHTAEDGRVFHRACGALAAAGYEVHLIATSSSPSIYTEKGVTIHPLPKLTSRRARLSRSQKVAEIAAAMNADLYHVHEPELLGPVLSRAQGRPVVYDVHESYLDLLLDRPWIPQPLRPLARIAWDIWERRLVGKCAAIIVVTERIAKRYRALHPLVSVVANYPELPEGADVPPGERDGKSCVFAGALSAERGLMEALAALALLRERKLEVPLVLAGKAASDAFLESFFAEAERLGVRDLVDFRGLLSRKAVMSLLANASIGLVTYLPLPNSIAGMPNKLVECMAMGLPVVFSNFPSYQEVAGETEAGIAVDPCQPAQIADAIERLVRNPELQRQYGENGRRAIRERFNWGVEQKKLLRLYEEVLGKRG